MGPVLNFSSRWLFPSAVTVTEKKDAPTTAVFHRHLTSILLSFSSTFLHLSRNVSASAPTFHPSTSPRKRLGAFPPPPLLSAPEATRRGGPQVSGLVWFRINLKSLFLKHRGADRHNRDPLRIPAAPLSLLIALNTLKKKKFFLGGGEPG